MSSVQFKIFYGDNFERCKMHRMKKERFELITYQEFACEVLKTVGAFLEGKTPRDVRIQYKNDEDTLGTLRNHDGDADDNVDKKCSYSFLNIFAIILMFLGRSFLSELISS